MHVFFILGIILLPLVFSLAETERSQCFLWMAHSTLCSCKAVTVTPITQYVQRAFILGHGWFSVLDGQSLNHTGVDRTSTN